MPTINKTFGVADPQYDALRVFSQQALQPGAGDGAGGGVLENKIYVWHADGSTVDMFDPDETGLNAALASVFSSAAGGDTVWLPSIQIDLTAPITLPIGVTVRGISRDGSILSFTGLSNESAVIHSTRSTLEHVTVIVAGAQPLVGVDARAAKARVRHVAVVMADHANNIKIYAGYAESA